MFLNRLWAEWQKYLHCYSSGTALKLTVSKVRGDQSQIFNQKVETQLEFKIFLLKIRFERLKRKLFL